MQVYFANTKSSAEEKDYNNSEHFSTGASLPTNPHPRTKSTFFRAISFRDECDPSVIRHLRDPNPHHSI